MRIFDGAIEYRMSFLHSHNFLNLCSVINFLYLNHQNEYQVLTF